MVCDWLAAQPQANQQPCEKMCGEWQRRNLKLPPREIIMEIATVGEMNIIFLNEFMRSDTHTIFARVASEAVE